MKNWSVYDWIAFMLACTVCIVLIICFAAPALLKIPTNTENKELRGQLVDMLNNVVIAIIALIAFKMKEKDKL